MIREKFEEIFRVIKEHKRSLLVFAVFALLALVLWYKGKLEAGDFDGTLERQGQTGSVESKSLTFRLEAGNDGTASDELAEEIGEQDLTLEIAPEEPDEEEAYELMNEAVSQLEEIYLGDNVSVNEVRHDLVLPSELCDGLVSVVYESSDYALLGADGAVTNDEADEEGSLVELTAEFSCGDCSRIETESLLILPAMTGTAEWVMDRVAEEAAGAEEASRKEREFSLPEVIAGYRVIWSEGSDYSWVYFLLLGALAAFCLEARGKQQERDYQKKRTARLEYEYPQMVDQFSVLMESGMTIRKAWERILARGYTGESVSGRNSKAGRESPYIEEMRITWREIRDGRGEREAYERFGNRIGLISYKRFASILTQNLSKGTRDLKELLARESVEALEERKNRARKMGEEAGAKMLFPMLVMLVLILLILLMPALTSMQT